MIVFALAAWLKFTLMLLLGIVVGVSIVAGIIIKFIYDCLNSK